MEGGGLLCPDCILSRALTAAKTLRKELEEAAKFVEAADRVIAKQREELEEAQKTIERLTKNPS